VVLGAHLERLPAQERDRFVRTVAERLPEPAIDDVRLDIVARRRDVERRGRRQDASRRSVAGSVGNRVAPVTEPPVE
jgi:hypothetical protein